MEIKRLTMDEIRFRLPYEVETLTCAVCEVALEASELWCCDDNDLTTSGQMLCNVVYLCDGCVSDEVKIRQAIRDIAAEYEADDQAHAVALRRMAQSPLTTM